MGLKGTRPQMSEQLELPLEYRGEAPNSQRSEEVPMAACVTERSGKCDLMEMAVRRPNLQAALKRVKSNKGSPGIDGMTVDELSAHLREHWVEIREQLLTGTYRPQMVKRQLIPKSGGGMRELGIPTVLDRFIQQAILQVLQSELDGNFSRHSYGFRPGKSAHQAVCAAQKYVQEGYRWVVEVDLEKFFDRVNHDVLMGKLAKRIGDHRVLTIIRRYLEADPCHRFWPTCYSMKWIRSWRSADTASSGMRMIATYTCNHAAQGNGSCVYSGSSSQG